MSLNIFWFLPTQGEGRYLGTDKFARTVDLAYLNQLALAVENLGYQGVLIPTGRNCDDAFLPLKWSLPGYFDGILTLSRLNI